MELETEALAPAHPGEEEGGSADGPNRRRLRQRSIVEGGYARLHMGLEEEEEDKKNLAVSPRPTPVKVTRETPLHAGNPGKRGFTSPSPGNHGVML